MKKLILTFAAVMLSFSVMAGDAVFIDSTGVGAGSGDVVGPVGATDGAIAVFDGPTGLLIKESGVTATAGGDLSAGGSLSTSGNITGNSMSVGTAQVNDINIVGGTVDRFLSLDGSKNVVYSNTSAALLASLSTKTGSNLAVFSDSPTIVTPAIASFTNATHNHLNSAGGGTITAAAVSDFDTQVRTNKLNQLTAPSADVSMNNFKLTNLATPTGAADAVTKTYADALASGLLTKTSCRLASTANVAGTYVGSPTFTLTEVGFGALSIDGVTPSVNDRILLKDQTTATQNGIYTVTAVGSGGSSYVLTRATDFDSSSEVLTGAYTFVSAGTANVATGFILITPATITLDTTNLSFTQFSGATNYIAGNGMSLSGLTFNVGAGTGIVANADDMQVDTAVVATTTNVLSMSNKTLTSPALTTPTLTGGTTGSIPYIGAASLITQDNANLFWNSTAKFLGIGTSSPTANLHINQAAASTGSPAAFTISGGPHTTLTASTEAVDFKGNFNRIVQFATGALATQRAVYFQAPTYAFVGASTLTTAATFAVSGAPAAGTNATITRPYSIMSENGNVAFTTSSNVGLTVDFLASNSTGSAKSVTFKAALTAASSATDFIFATTGTTRTAGNLFNVVNNATSKFLVSYAGNTTITQSAVTSGSPNALLITGGAHTTLAAGVEATDVFFNLGQTKQFATGAIANQRTVIIAPPTYSAVAASTFSKVATLSLGAPSAGTNATFTSTSAMSAGGPVSLASVADLSYATLNVTDHTLTLTGATNLTSGGGVTGLAIGQITATSGSAISIANAASVYIKDAPVAGGSVTLTAPYALFVDAGATRLDGAQYRGVTTASTATYNVTTTEYIIHSTRSATGTGTINLPAAASNAGRVLFIKDAGLLAGTNAITVDANGAETIDGSLTYVMSGNGETLELYCDGVAWFRLAS